MPTDYYMHNSLVQTIDPERDSLKPLTEWVRPFILKHLPYSTADANKIVDELICVHSRDLEMVDFYSHYHSPYKWTTFEEHIVFQISHLARVFTPTFRTNFSPFEPAARRTENRGILKNPSLTGQSSTGSTNSSNSSMAEDSSSEDDSISENLNLQPSSLQTYTSNDERDPFHQATATGIQPPRRVDMLKYKRYAKMGKILMYPIPNTNPKLFIHRQKREIALAPTSDYGEDNFKAVSLPKVGSRSIDIYEKYVESPEAIYDHPPSRMDFEIITKYFNNEC